MQATQKHDAKELPVYTGDSLAKNNLAFLTDSAAFNHLWRVATGYSRSKLVPEQFRGKSDDCFIICQLAIRLNVDPFMLMQSTYIVHGRPGFEAKLAIALLNSSGKIKGTVKTEFSGIGDDYGCRAWCVDAETGDRVDGPKIDIKMVKAEGWLKDNGTQKSKWATMPDMMFRYRAASYLIKTNYPEVLMGMPTVEEVEDVATVRTTTAMTNQTRVEALLAGAPDDPERAIEMETDVVELHKEATATNDLVGKQSPKQVVAQDNSATHEDIDLFVEFTDALAQAESIDAVRSLQTQYADSFDAHTAQRAQEKAETRIIELNPKAARGSRSNK